MDPVARPAGKRLIKLINVVCYTYHVKVTKQAFDLMKAGRFFYAQYKAGEALAKGKYQYWLTEDGQALLRDWARNGATDEQIAERMHIGTTTLYRWKNEHREIRDALKESKDICDSKIESVLYEKAKKGDTTALIFWLKNRRPDKWRDKPEPDPDAATMKKIEELLGGVDSAID